MSETFEDEKSKIFIVDDHPMVREHLAGLIQRESDLEVCGEAADAPTALTLIAQKSPDLVVLDISLKQSHGLELLKDLKVLHPDLPVLVLSMHDENLYAERVLRAGGRGYITKQEATLNILQAIRQVLAGEVYLSTAMASRVMRKMVGTSTGGSDSPLEVLTDRELEVFQLIGRGLGTRQIAAELKIGIKTIESYRARIRTKLHLSDGTQLLHRAVQWVESDAGR